MDAVGICPFERRRATKPEGETSLRACGHACKDYECAVTRHVLPVVALRVGKDLQLAGDAASDTEMFDARVRAVIRRMNAQQRAAVSEQLASVWKQFDPDAAYVLVALGGESRLRFEDDLELMDWLKWVQAEIDLAG